MSTPTERFSALREATDHLEIAVNALVAHKDRPKWDQTKQRFRFPTQSPQVIQLCKAVRVVSGLNACLTLHPRVHYAEILMLLRGVADFLGEITFLHEGLQSGQFTADQKRFIEHFFAEYGAGSGAEIVANPPRGSLVERKKIQAAQARLLTPDNPHEMQITGLAIDAVMSGYMHGSYQSVMELYESGTHRFRLNGMVNTPRAREAERQIVLNVHRAFNVIGCIGWSMNDAAVFDSIRAARITFELSAACEGMNLAVPGVEIPDTGTNQS